MEGGGRSACLSEATERVANSREGEKRTAKAMGVIFAQKRKLCRRILGMLRERLHSSVARAGGGGGGIDERTKQQEMNGQAARKCKTK